MSVTEPPTSNPRPHRFAAVLLLTTGLVAAAAAVGRAGAPDQPPHVQVQPGYLVVEAAWDTTTGFRWDERSADGRRILTWPEGSLNLPDTLVAERFSRRDLGVPTLAGLTGSGASGRLALIDGIYAVSEPLTVTDGRLELTVAAGELEIRGPLIRYRTAAAHPPVKDLKSGWLLLAGMTLLVVVLLRRARMKAGERSLP